MKTNKEILANRMSERSDIRIISNNSFLDYTQNYNIKRKNDGEINSYNLNSSNYSSFSNALSGKDIRLPDPDVNINKKNYSIKGCTRSQRNVDELNNRLNNFKPLIGNSAYPLFSKINYENKPISTRNINENK